MELGGWDPMVQTKRLLQDDPSGAFLTNWRIHTPICRDGKVPSQKELASFLIAGWVA